ncbi:hypothetical protein acsn021_17490 [Anaerocolumna cellulosilytica]|uniref:Uncharacterized protein n=1 Tax=Anaerocolumna cellulosilytica TaxID=433286 RepID=A0A6S6R456_9FIRM|nr:hypothetical protein [Anaerocolumna cellulosilytica]MBB5194857.1 hypothetical protein [Anaerocolumna cellulosilytica]BCJ94180.1 hypothetical protein acsn021_17490 [Anaerocolumna cellulosilytica]
MKSKFIPFNDFWINCVSTITYSVLLSSKQVDKSIVYNNNYVYDIVTDNMESSNTFNSIVVQMKHEEMNARIFTNGSIIEWTDEYSLINTLISNLDLGKVVTPGVDLYYCIDENMYRNKFHKERLALLNGYDKEKEIFYVFEMGKSGYSEHIVPYHELTLAASKYTRDSFISDIGDNLDEFMYQYSDILQNANEIIASMNLAINQLDLIWNIDALNEFELNYFGNIVQTYIFSMQNRQKANRLLFQNVFANDVKSEEKFVLLEKEYENMKNLIIRDVFYNKKIKEKIFQHKERLKRLLLEEKYIWESKLS